MIPEPIQRFIDQQAERSLVNYSDLKVVFLNGTLKGRQAPVTPTG